MLKKIVCILLAVILVCALCACKKQDTPSQNGDKQQASATQANATQAMAAFDAGFAHATHFYNAMSTFHKENGIVHAGVIEAAYIRDDVTIELIVDGRHIPKESMLLAYRVKGPERICLNGPARSLFLF